MPVRIPQRTPNKWIRFQESLREVGSALGDREKQRRAKSEALKTLIMGEVIKNEFKKDAMQQQMQMIQKMLGQQGQAGQGQFGQAQGLGQPQATLPSSPQLPNMLPGQNPPITQGAQGLPGANIPRQIVEPTVSYGPSGTTVSLSKKINPQVGQRKEMLANATTLRKEFNQAKVFKEFQILRRSEDSIKRAYELSKRPGMNSRIASDQALGVLFQKMLDPDSVVRESEYARTPEGAGLMNRLRSYLPKLQRGGLALTNEDRGAIYETANALFNGYKQFMNQHIDRYTQLSQSYGVNPNLVLGNIKRMEVKELPVGAFIPKPMQNNKVLNLKKQWGLE